MPYDHMTGYKSGIHDIDASTSGRNNLTGNMHRDKITEKRTVEVTLSYITVEQMRQFLTLINDPEFTLKYFDSKDGIKTGKFNASADRVVEFVEGNDQLYKSFSIELTEV